MSSRGSWRLAILGCAALVACAPALRAPPPLSSAGQRPNEVEGLLGQASASFARRDPESVRQAVSTWLAAAAADETRTEGLEGAARGNVWLADHEREAGRRAEAATAAVQAAQLCLLRRPDSAACLYWLGAGLGLQAREKPSTGLSALPKIEDAFVRAAAADPLLEDAGPERALALFYLRAPSWPRGPGDPDRGLDQARRAVELRGDYPPNALALAEALRKTEDRAGSREEYRRALELAERRSRDGDPDAAEWVREAQEALARATGK